MPENSAIILMQDEIKNLPVVMPSLDELDHRAKHYRAKSRADATRLAYMNDLKIFKAWCDQYGLQPIPATPQTVTFFLTWCADQQLRASTIERRRAAIHYAHKLAGLSTPTTDPEVTTTMEGIRNALGTKVNKKKPITIKLLLEMLDHCPDSLVGLRDRALLVLDFCGAFRRSEVVSLQVHELELVPKGLKAHLKKSKTDQQGKGRIVPIFDGKTLKVRDTVKTWLLAAHIDEGAIFRAFKRNSTSVRKEALSSHSVAHIIKHYVELAGYNPEHYSGHSIRRGFLTSAAAAGVPLKKLMSVSGHKKFDTVMEYIEDEELFEDHAGESFL